MIPLTIKEFQHGKSNMCLMKKLTLMLRGAAYSICKLRCSIPREIQAKKKVHKFIFTTNPFIILKHISDISTFELHSLSSFHLYNIIHKNSYFCQDGYHDKLQ